jgi:hypothetical protein
MDRSGGPAQVGPVSTWRRRLSGPVLVGVIFATLAIALTWIGLWREHIGSLRNLLLGAVLGGGTWGLISWAIATAVAQVEEDIASDDSHTNGPTPPDH